MKLGDVDVEHLKCSINRRKEFCNVLEYISMTSMVVAVVVLIVEVMGNAIYWADWVANNVLSDTFYRFQSGWILFGVCAVIALVTLMWEDYLHNKNLNAQVFYRSLTRGKQ